MSGGKTMPFFRLEQFSVWRAQVQIVREVSVSLREGDVLALAGSNGAGKTTLLEGIAGLHATEGESWLGERRLSSEELAGVVSLSPDGRHLFPDMTVRENLLLGAYRSGFAAGQERVVAMLEVVPWLQGRMGQRAGTLSGGEQQLVAVCRAAIAQPILLLLDEPTSGLAPAFRNHVADLIRRFVAEGGRAVLIADDDDDFLRRVSSVRATVSGGRLTLDCSAP